MPLKPDDVRRVAQWIEDLRSGEIIEAKGYRRNYLCLSSPTLQKDLDDICDMFNKYVLVLPEAIDNSMGEIIPSKSLKETNYK